MSSIEYPPTLLFLGTEEDRAYVPRLKPLVGASRTFVLLTPITTLIEVILYCKKRDITGVFSTNKVLLSKLLTAAGNPKASPSLDKYAGSYFSHQGIEFVIINPLDQLVSVSYGQFLARRYISKLTAPKTWNEVPKFDWCMLDPSTEQTIYTKYSRAYAIAVDIETYRKNLAIRCIGFTALFVLPGGTLKTHSCVLPLTDNYNLAIARKFLWELKAPKIFQNGKYDLSYLSRYNIVPYNYLWDTATLMHCWYAELPKDLAFLGGFFVRKAMYWKDLAETSDLETYYKYNALDTWTTMNVWVAQMLQLPTWARNNYLLEFPLVFPCHLAEMIGIKRDMEKLPLARAKVDTSISADNESLSRMVGVYPASFNVNSAPQNKALRKILGSADVKSSDEKSLKKIANRHPLNSRICNKILDIRGNRKLASTYLRVDTDSINEGDDKGGKEFNGRILYALNPHGTATGRLASREHHFWCGLQIQNIPREDTVKSTLVADEGFRFIEVDLEQAESRDTAFISGDKNLIAAVSSERDFHSINASSFFGVPYESIYDDTTRKTKDKILRDLAKRVNHGANYNMGPNVLVDTMGEDKIWEAKRLLKLPVRYGLKDVAEYLLSRFHETYKSLKGSYYPSIVHRVLTTRMLCGATGWTRYCFGNPKDTKSDLNSYIAHEPQSLNAMVLNKAFLRVFYEIALHPTYSRNFKLCAQIHDSILFQVREGHEDLALLVKSYMEIPVKILGCDKVWREFTVPAAIKAGKDGKGAKYWNETE